MRKKIIGIGLLELMLALAIIAVIFTMAVRYFSVANLSGQVNTAVTQVEAISSAATQWWNSNNHDFTSLQDINLLVNRGYLNKESANNPWGDVIAINGISNNLAQITLKNIPVKACANLMQKFNLFYVIPFNPTVIDCEICIDGSKKYSLCNGSQ